MKQRIAIRLALRRLDRDAVEEYIRFRWAKVGREDPAPFASSAIDGIACWSNGIPRLINVICDNALLIAFSETSRTVSVQMVREACEELSLPTPTITPRAPSFAGARPYLGPAEQTAPESTEKVGPEAPSNGWAASSPSLAKRWSRLTNSQPRRPTRSRTSIFSLNEPWP